jgi:glycosyltransferase involved in cell wall biosynthesis
MKRDVLKILMLNAEYNGCAYWRMFEPARFLNMCYRDAAVTYFPHDAFLSKLTSEWERLAMSHDLIVFGRVSTPEALQTMGVVREFARKPVVVELDDNWATVDSKNLAYQDWYPGSLAYRCANAQMNDADFLQVSTFPLKRAMAYKYGKRCWISPNLIDFEKMDNAYQEARKVRKHHDQIRIGWAGSATHYGDFITFLDTMKIIADKYPKVTFVFRGMKADFFSEQKDGYCFKKDKIQVIKGCPIDLSRIEYHDGGEFWTWPKMLAEMDLDIVVVPLADNAFNKSKSNCRYLEFSSLRVPGVYADLLPYNGTVHDGVDGYLASTTEDWVRHLSALVESEELRQEIALKAYKNVEENWSLQNKIGLWKKNFEEMAEAVDSTPFISYMDGEASDA